MHLPFLNHDPIVVEVTEDRWDSYGPLTYRSAYLTQYLQNMGGINESVPPGTYHFNIRRRGLFKVAVSLEPYTE